MSRIDDALRQLGRQERPADADVPGQEVFAPEWTVEGASTPDPIAADLSVVEHAIQPVGLVSFASKWRERLASGSDADPALVEQFRRLAATLHHAHHANGLRSVMITSASPGDGKTLTSVNLALVLVQSYRYNVLLVDADLRRPSLPNVAEVAGSAGDGLSEVLRANGERKLALVPIVPGLTLLPAGQPVANSIEALTSPRMRQILDEAATRFDWIVVDAPPVGITTDARLLAEMVGGALFVIRAGTTQHSVIQQGIDALGREHIIGVVLNGSAHEAGDYYYGGTDTGGR